MSARQRAPWLARILAKGTGSAPDTAVHIPTELPTPLTRDRVGAYLTRRGYTFRLDDDDDITGTWDGNRFWFLLLGTQHEILQVRGRWHRPLADSGRLAVLQIINDWNRERIWPKAYLRAEPAGLALYTEVSVDFGPGATKNQLEQMVACGLGTSIQLFTSVSALLPPEDPDDLEGMDDNGAFGDG
ncbi:Putative sensory transduction regulator [Sanguibacter gelidistatuariae]|uniref:Putative sensory transduction regulator n=1 Tax=Sanguibacter gelidistatuariae TaxID=1814289 RepID=A0A1G6NUR1_9MICO|nr:YbjN domain-containing protein [Sanguibacter gelidistatuariae]SDC70905.1 Putative sensory transduction regulator [Sanguibacter gelidistatuariae]